MNLLFEGLFIETLEVRDIVRRTISPSILTHRKSTLTYKTSGYVRTGTVTDTEIEEFLLSIPYFDRTLTYYLLGDGYIGQSKTTLWVYALWLEEVIEKIKFWAESDAWLYGELILIHQPGMLAKVEYTNEKIQLPELMQTVFLK